MKKSLFKLMEINQKKHWWYISRRKIFFYLLRNLKQKKMKILDYGCGVGSNISVLKMISKNIEVYDYNKNILKQVIKKNKIKAYKKNNKYDLILLTDVLEHVKKDKNLFDKLSRQLNKNGHIFLTVPAFQFLYSNKDVLAGHFRRYNKTQLIKTCSNRKMKVKKISYFNFFLFLPLTTTVIVFKVLGWKFKKKHMLPPNRIINKILIKIFSFEKYLLNNITLPFGFSILAIFKKI